MSFRAELTRRKHKGNLVTQQSFGIVLGDWSPTYMHNI